ncbi:MAG: glycoside hydrolase family 31 protein [Bacteroidetes bacterium]|nr:glycoside hydrolase family 31 protein [Bacteroidota bacterium]
MMNSKIKYLILLLLIPVLAYNQEYISYSKQSDGLKVIFKEGMLSITPYTEHSVRVKFEKEGISENHDFVIIDKPKIPKFSVNENQKSLSLLTETINITLEKKSGQLIFSKKNGEVFLSEKIGGRLIKEASLNGEKCLEITQTFDSPQDERLFGLGQFQDGFFNLKNIPRKLIQVNSQIAIPFLISSKGYGLLWNQYGITYFNPANISIPLFKKDSTDKEKKEADVTTTSGTQRMRQQQAEYLGKFSIEKDGYYSFFLDLGNMESRHFLMIDDIVQIDQSNLWLPPAVGKLIYLKAGEHSVKINCKSSNVPSLAYQKVSNETVFSSPNAKSLDYFVFSGENSDEIISEYRNLTGTVPMLPKWAFGFWQCRERYTSGKHLVETVKEFRNRNLPMDVIVQDWQYWGKYGWGVPKFDETHYPEPENFIKELHDLNSHFSLSVWENIDKKSEIAQEYISKNLYIPESPWIDMFNPESQVTHWNVLDKNLFQKGVDSWWMDATEPENDALAGKNTFWGKGEFYRLTYPFFVSKAVYEGQRKANSEKRVTILTRSAFPGQQRFATINWSGDIGWSWDTYKRQVVAGLNYNLTGMPFWTTDIGGFFRPGRGQYTDEKYHEILIRWFQWGAFNPVFRSHGYQTETEPWKYGEKVESNMRKMLNLRYRLMPYIYSEAWKITHDNSTMMRPLLMDFKNDPQAIDQAFQYMFGKSILVAPITEPGVKDWKVYLPKGQNWFDFWTNQSYSGGNTISTPAPLDLIPLFVKEGSIIPMGNLIQHTQAVQDTLEIRIYTGKNASFKLYNDEGDNYNYEKGNYSEIPLIWDEKSKYLKIGNKTGAFQGDLESIQMNVIFINKNSVKTLKSVIYKGKELKLKM